MAGAYRNPHPPPGVYPDMSTCIALLRGVNVGGHNKVPMAELRDRCGEAGLDEVETYIQSGNLVLDAPESPRRVEARVEAVIRDAFDLDIPVIARSAETWDDYIRADPLKGATSERPKRVRLCLSKAPVADDAQNQLRERAVEERIEAGKDALWIDYGPRGADSGLTTALLDRLVGSTVTSRNWNTVLELQKLANKR